jgi:AcrR family transcriptional regulator
MNLGPERPLRRRDEARALFRNAILDAAEAVFAERGFHGARIQDIAERARIAVGTVYNHFEQKDDVLSALLEERTEGLIARVRAGAEQTPRAKGFRPRLAASVGGMFEYVGEHRAFFAIANELGFFSGKAAPSARSSERNLQKTEVFRALLRELVDEGVASGDLGEVDPDALARFLGSTMRAFVLASLDKTDSDMREHAVMTIDLFLHGARRRRRRAK